MAYLFKRRIICEEKECNKYVLLEEEFLEIYKLVFHGNQHFEEGHRLIKHCFKKENEKLKCRTLLETNIQGESKYKDVKSNEYPDVESFQNWMSLPEIEIQESIKKRKGDIISLREEGRLIKIRITKKLPNGQKRGRERKGMQRGRTQRE